MGESATVRDSREAPARVQLLTPEGERCVDHDHRYVGGRASIAALYREMVLMRRFDTEGFALQRQGEMALWPPSYGQEAAQVGSASALHDCDFIYATYRETGIGRMRGVAVQDLLAVWRGSSLGGWDAVAHGFAPMSIVIGGHVPHAVGHALGLRLRGTRSAVVAYFGDGATSQGDVLEAFEFAALQDAPVVFFCQNNHYAISLPVRQQTAVPLVQRAAGFGLPAVQIDGNDVLACHAVMAEAADRARSGGGPTFIEAVTYRMGPHTTSDDPTRYRDAGELDAWRARDPLDRARRHLEGLGISSTFFADVDTEADALATQVREACAAIPEPDLADWFERVFVESTTELRLERAEYVAWREQYQPVDLSPA